jgi:hypothetical protein
MAIKLVILFVAATVRKTEFKVFPDNQNIYVLIATTIKFLLGPKYFI